MAFSYSDKNFTVVGNLCFVHIVVQGIDSTYTIPPAIRDRMLFDNFVCTYYSYNSSNSRSSSSLLDYISLAIFASGNIKCVGKSGNGYLFCYFPIDSNK